MVPSVEELEGRNVGDVFGIGTGDGQRFELRLARSGNRTMLHYDG